MAALAVLANPARRVLRRENIRPPSADTDEVGALAPEPRAEPDTEPETEHRMVYLKNSETVPCVVEGP